MELIDVDEDRIVLVMRRNPDSERSYAEMGVPEGHDESADMVTIRDGKVMSMQDYKTKADALAAVSDGGDGA